MADQPRGRVPKARAELVRVATRLSNSGCAEEASAIRWVIDTLMYRRPVKKPTARATARKMTGPLVLEIREAVAANPTRGNRATGRLFGVDGGRVSECIQGLRCPVTGDLLDEPSPLL